MTAPNKVWHDVIDDYHSEDIINQLILFNQYVGQPKEIITTRAIVVGHINYSTSQTLTTFWCDSLDITARFRFTGERKRHKPGDIILVQGTVSQNVACDVELLPTRRQASSRVTRSRRPTLVEHNKNDLIECMKGVPYSTLNNVAHLPIEAVEIVAASMNLSVADYIHQEWKLKPIQ